MSPFFGKKLELRFGVFVRKMYEKNSIRFGVSARKICEKKSIKLVKYVKIKVNFGCFEYK